MTYTPSPLKSESGKTNFGGLVVDGNRIGMTGVLGSQFVTQDATGTPVTSPVTVNTTKTLVVPSTAVQLTLISTSNAVQVSEDSTQSVYFTLPAATLLVMDVARQQNVYLKTGSST